MSNIEIRNLLAKLRDEIQKSELDAKTQDLVREFDADVHDLLDSDKTEDETAFVLKRAKEFEADFETEHPTTVRILSEVIEALSRMGI
jgi:hemerythrin superfamily protein